MNVMGVPWAMDDSVPIVDPDPSYELTMDNLLKILAIYMRLRANIPVKRNLLFIQKMNIGSLINEYTSDNHGRDWMWQDPTVQIYVRAAKKTKSRDNKRQ